MLPGSAFGDRPGDLRVRAATSLLYGETEEQRVAALDADHPQQLPWVRGALEQLERALRALTGLDADWDLAPWPG